MPWTRRPLLALVILALVLAGAVSCSDDDPPTQDGSEIPITTAAVASSIVGTSSTVSTTTAPSTEGTPPGGPASSLPPGDPEQGTGSACATFTDMLALQALLPREGLSWADERLRVITDARNTAELYRRVAGQLPDTEGQYATIVGDFAGFIADQTQDAASAEAARSAIDASPQQGEVAAANAELERWRGVNCG